jgi:hypothetical protein
MPRWSFESADRAPDTPDNRKDVRATDARALIGRLRRIGRLKRIVKLLPGPPRLLRRLIFLLRRLRLYVGLLGCI